MNKETLFPPQSLEENNLTWVYMMILAEKGTSALDMLVADSQEGVPAFFRYLGSIEDDTQVISIDWKSKTQDTKVLQDLMTFLQQRSSVELSTADLNYIHHILAESPLFMAMGATSIVVTKEQASQQGEGITPLEHITRVADWYLSVPLHSEDVRVAQLLPWLHDIGKMAGVHFLQEGAINDPEVRATLKEKYGKNGKHTHPSHSEMGAVITKELLAESDSLGLSDAQEALLLNMIFHHHDFIYYGEEAHGPLESWVATEIAEKLVPTLPENSPELIVRFFALLAQFRYADIGATQQHHRHWAGNHVWFSQLPDVLQKILPETEEVAQQIDTFRAVVAAMPSEI